MVGLRMVTPRWLTIAQAAQYTGYAKGTLYNLVSERRIPYVKKHGKTLRFDAQKLDAWMERDEVRCADDF